MFLVLIAIIIIIIIIFVIRKEKFGNNYFTQKQTNPSGTMNVNLLLNDQIGIGLMR